MRQTAKITTSELDSFVDNIKRVKRIEKRSSQYKGIKWDRSRGSWKAEMQINRVYYFIGRFTTEQKAKQALDAFRAAKKVKEKGTSFDKKSNKWYARYNQIHLGSFVTEEEAKRARKEYEESIVRQKKG